MRNRAIWFSLHGSTINKIFGDIALRIFHQMIHNGITLLWYKNNDISQAMIYIKHEGMKHSLCV